MALKLLINVYICNCFPVAVLCLRDTNYAAKRLSAALPVMTTC